MRMNHVKKKRRNGIKSQEAGRKNVLKQLIGDQAQVEEAPFTGIHTTQIRDRRKEKDIPKTTMITGNFKLD